ncbi:MAG: hypothetical protein HQL71_01270 [Magnetococcales bacterium]|nr:hypothetical protein [Magnetococcales bacterium]
MKQTISTVLAANEVMQITGPGAVQVAYSNSMAVSTAKASAVTKGAATAGLISTSFAPIIGLAILVGGLTLMVKMAGGYATSKN